MLEIEDGLEDIHKMIEEKANRIEEKLVKIEKRDSEEEKDEQNQLVPYIDHTKARAVVSTLKYDADGVISLSDVDDEEIDKMILTDEERRLKKIIWDNLNKDWLKEQKKKKRERKEKRKLQATAKKVSRVKSKSLLT